MLLIGLNPPFSHPVLHPTVGAVCFDWGGTLMVDNGPDGVPMCRWPKVAAVSGALECLAALHGRIPLCVATNAGQSDRAMIEQALDRVDLLRYIDHVFCFTEIGAAKDRPEFWRAVSESLDLPPAEIVMIGDSIENDVQTPLRHGFQSVWFDAEGIRGRSAIGAPIVTDLGAFAAMVTEVMAR